MYDHNDRRILDRILKNTETLMTNVAEVEAAIATLKADLETDATAALAEFTKLETEVAEGKGATPEDLTPLKTALEALDTSVKAAVTEIPST